MWGGKDQAPAWLQRSAWPLFAGASWALVMGLGEKDAAVLAPGLRQSMELIYRDEAKTEAGGWGALLSPATWMALIRS